MTDKAAPPPSRRIADNSANWPALAALLAPAPDCDCQVLAMAITDQFGPAPPIGRAAPKPIR